MPGKKRPRVIQMPMDFGDRKTRRNYSKPGEIHVYRIDKLPLTHPIRSEFMDYSFADLMHIEKDVATKWLLKECNGVSDSKMGKRFGISAYKMRQIRGYFGVEKDQFGYTLIDGKRFDDSIVITKPRSSAGRPPSIPLHVQDQKTLEEAVPAFKIEIHGNYKAEDLLKRIEGIQLFLDSQPDSKFEFQLIVLQRS
jgi:hypothetical protein